MMSGWSGVSRMRLRIMSVIGRGVTVIKRRCQMSNDGGCPICGVEKKDQHSNHESGVCDGIRKDYLKKENGKIVQTEKGKAGRS
jgi:hypothetical protein